MYSTPWRAVLAALADKPIIADQQLHDSADDAAKTAEKAAKRYEKLMEASGFRQNAAGDLEIFTHSLLMNLCIFFIAICLFAVLRRWVPEIYANNCRRHSEGGRETAPCTPSQSFFGWVKPAWRVTYKEVWETAGLDAALMLEFERLAWRLLLLIGVPLCTILCPLHFFFGGDRAVRAGDHLSRLGLNNVVDGSDLFYVHAVAVWYVILVAEYIIFEGMKGFLIHRFQWLREFTFPQACTVLVENIPPEYRSDKALKEIFAKLFPGRVESAVLVKDTCILKGLSKRLHRTDLDLEMLVYKSVSRAEGTPPDPKVEENIALLTEKVAKLQEEVSAERMELLEAATQVERALTIPGDITEVNLEKLKETGETLVNMGESLLQGKIPRVINTPSGFVTFLSMRDALTALNTRCSADLDEFLISLPPQPNDVIYEDLMRPAFVRRIRTMIGALCLMVLFVGFMPIVMVISGFTNLESLQENSDIVRGFLSRHPWLYAPLEGFLATIALVLMMSFLPTLLMIIFTNFYTIKAHAWAQQKVHRYYFCFLITFVLLLTAVGHSIVSKFVMLYHEPQKLAGVLADALPEATHFYLDFMLVQIMQLGLALTRYVQLIKFKIYHVLVGRQRAIEMCEPEDQDFYGIGARSAREALDLVIAIVFSSLCPLIALVTSVRFCFARLVYGYLLVFAEQKKADLGGPFFVELLWQVQCGLVIYICLMCGVLLRRAGRTGPLLIILPALPYVLMCMWRFNTAFIWKNLPMIDVCDEEASAGFQEKKARRRADCITSVGPPYMQPELQDGALSPRFLAGYNRNVRCSRQSDTDLDAPPSGLASDEEARAGAATPSSPAQ